MHTIKFYLKLIYTILAIHLSVYAVALARYEFAVFSLDAKIANLTTLSEGKSPNLALERIPRLQIKLPIEPKIYNIATSIKSLFPCFDNYEYNAYQEMSYLLAHNKHNLKNLNLNGLIFFGSSRTHTSADFKRSNFENVKLVGAVLTDNIFRYSKFYKVDFFLARMNNTDFEFVTFDHSDLTSANLENCNLCGARFINTIINTVNLKKSNLIGVDLSNSILRFPGLVDKGLLENLQGAYYNSKKFTIFDDRQFEFVMQAKCHDLNQYPPTKFPEWFYPEAHGMIDISKW